MTDLARRWRELRVELGWGDEAAAAGEALVDRYAEPHRRYHTVAHLRAVLETLDELAPGLPAAVRLAGWFHDAVYDPTADDNEERSAALAVETLRGLGSPAALGDEVATLVMATKSHVVAGIAGADVLVDADLAVLGAPADAYRAYAVAIRHEYAHVDGEEFRAARQAVLEGFLARPAIFASAAGANRFEARARANLAVELAGLRGPLAP